MKTAVLLAVGAASVAVAKPHGHAHHHHKREPDAVTVSTPVSTAFAFVIGDQVLSQAEACQGLADGSYRFEGEKPELACPQVSSVALPTSASPSSAAPSSSSASAAASSPAAAQFFQQSAATSSAAATSSTPSASSTSSSAAAASSSSTSTSSANGIIGTITKFVSELAKDDYPDFEDGVHSCSDGPPTQYGAMPVDYLGLNGWVSFQVLNDAQNDIVRDGDTCGNGAACAYSCFPGYQNMQWVEDQPSNGASIGGLLCKDGKLYKANSNPKLCGKGVGGVTVKNEANGHIAVCRTNYPATEDETIPVDVDAGSVQPLTCPDGATYYQHLGKPTSAQYYLNPIGVSASEGCHWNGKNDGQTGNWAPINFGVGYSGGVKWLSIFQNAPTSNAVFLGTVNITGDGISGSCSYEPTADGKDGKYCGSAGCQTISSGTNAGCTVSQNFVTVSLHEVR